jgi:hypothetical protein
VEDVPDHRGCIVGRIIVDDDDFRLQLAGLLSKKVCQRGSEAVGAVVCADDY